MGSIPSCYCVHNCNRTSTGINSNDQDKSNNFENEIDVPNNKWNKDQMMGNSRKNFKGRGSKDSNENIGIKRRVTNTIINFKNVKHVTSKNVKRVIKKGGKGGNHGPSNSSNNNQENTTTKSTNDSKNIMSTANDKIPVKRIKSSIVIKPTNKDKNYIMLNNQKTAIARSNSLSEAKNVEDYLNELEDKLNTWNNKNTATQLKWIHTSDKSLSPDNFLFKHDGENYSPTVNTNRDNPIAPPDENETEIVVNKDAPWSATRESPSPRRKRVQKRKDYEEINEPFTEEQLTFIKQILFSEEMWIDEMSSAVINTIINEMSMIRIKPNFVLYNTKDNKNDNNYYIIYKGKLEMKIDNSLYELEKSNTITTKAVKKNTVKYSYLKAGHKRVYLYVLPLNKYISIFSDFVNKIQEEKWKNWQKVFLFNAFDKKSLSKLSNLLMRKRFTERTLLIKENELQETIYLIIEGSVICFKNDEIIKRLAPWDIFGDITWYSHTPSYYSYIVEPETEIYVIKYSFLDDVLGERTLEKLIHSIFLNSIKSSEIISKYFNVSNIGELYNKFQWRYYFNDTLITLKNKKLFIPISGIIYKTDTPVKAINTFTYKNDLNFDKRISKNGEMFGESFLNETETTLKYSILSDECVIFEASWTDIWKWTKSYSDPEVSMYTKINLIRKYPLFKGISEWNLFNLAECVKLVSFKYKDCIIKDGPGSDKFFMLVKGKVQLVINDIEFKVIEPPKSFGDITTQSNGNYVRKASYFAASNVVECYSLDKEAYEDVVDCSILKPYNNLLVWKDITVSLEQLYYLRDLGQGSYGKVYWIHDKKRLYAMKTAEINMMVQNKQCAQGYWNEKSIMSSIEHPFIVQLINTFKTKEYIFFLIEYISGMTWREYITDKANNTSLLRNISEISFIASILCYVLNYLQKKRIIHRDLKPDNLMVDSDGYIKVIDFGIAKALQGKDATHTLIGTVHYMAPEVVQGKAYSFSADIWSVGVIWYEVFYGKLPFGFGLKDAQSVYDEINNKKWVIACDPKIECFNAFIKEILHRTALQRTTNFKKWRSYELFKGLEFDSIRHRNLKSPLFLKRETILAKDKMDDLLGNTICPFYQFMKNNICASSTDLDEMFKKNEKANDYLSDF